jgi:hypothetical protein
VCDSLLLLLSQVRQIVEKARRGWLAWWSMIPKNKKVELAIAFTLSLGNKTRHLAGFFRLCYCAQRA